MKRVFLGELLQTIYLDVSVYENSYMYIHKINNDEMYKTTYIAKKHNLEDILNDLYKQIHPRYTKVIIDCGIVNNKMIRDMIDKKYNNYIPKVDKLKIDKNGVIKRLFIPEQMLEMVQVVMYNPKRIDVKQFIKNKKHM